MAKKKTKPFKEFGTVAVNRRARHDYAIEDEFEAGLQLVGSEVKALREGKCSITEAYADEREGEIYLLNAHIAEYPAAMFNHEPKRPRKLLLHKREMDKILGSIHQKGYTLVPLDIHFNSRGIAKLRIALAKGKRKVDKREAEKEKDWQRKKQQILKEYG